MNTTAIIDSHCHLNFDDFDDDRDQIIQRAIEKNIEYIIVPATQKNDWAAIQTLCLDNKILRACYGFHPYWADTPTNKDYDALEAWVNNTPCIGIGECGLDYREGQVEKKIQLKLFEAQLCIADNNQLPIVIHSINATEDVIKLIKKHRNLKGKMHSYTGSYQQAQQLVDLDFYISFGGTITYQNALKHRATASKLPLSHIMVESNAPDQPDSSHKSERNEPAYIIHVLNCLEELREERLEEITENTTQNAKRLFNLYA